MNSSGYRGSWASQPLARCVFVLPTFPTSLMFLLLFSFSFSFFSLMFLFLLSFFLSFFLSSSFSLLLLLLPPS